MAFDPEDEQRRRREAMTTVNRRKLLEHQKVEVHIQSILTLNLQKLIINFIPVRIWSIPLKFSTSSCSQEGEGKSEFDLTSTHHNAWLYNTEACLFMIYDSVFLCMHVVTILWSIWYSWLW